LLERADLGPPDETVRHPRTAPPRRRDAPQEETREETRREENRDERPTSPTSTASATSTAPTGGSRRDDDDREDFTQFAAHEPTLQEHLLASSPSPASRSATSALPR